MKKLTLSALLISTISTGLPFWSSQASAGQDWQVRRLMSPSAGQQAAESRGRVEIYDSLHEDQVDQALDNQFGRIENMMFVRVQHSEPDGTTWEDDDCD